MALEVERCVRPRAGSIAKKVEDDASESSFDAKKGGGEKLGREKDDESKQEAKKVHGVRERDKIADVDGSDRA